MGKRHVVTAQTSGKKNRGRAVDASPIDTKMRTGNLQADEWLDTWYKPALGRQANRMANQYHPSMMLRLIECLNKPQARNRLWALKPVVAEGEQPGLEA